MHSYTRPAISNVRSSDGGRNAVKDSDWQLPAAGTGGHVLPALAVIEELRRRGALADVIWIGSRDGLERQAAEEAGIPFVAIPTGKLRRYLSLRNLTDAARVPLGVLAARRALPRSVRTSSSAPADSSASRPSWRRAALRRC